MQGAQCVRRVVSARLLPLAAALALCASLATPPMPAHADPSGTLAMSPASASISVGQTISITLDINGAASLHEADLFVLYDPGVVQPVDADGGTSGTQILPGPFPGSGAVTANAAAGGTIQYAYTLPASAEASGSGTLATVQFLAVGDGDAGLSWGAVSLYDASFAQATPSANAGILMVGAAAPTVTASATATSSATATRTATPTATASPSGSATATRTSTPTRTPTSTATAASSATAKPSATPRLTALRVDGTPTRTISQKLGVDGAGTKPQNSLPNAGNGGPGVQWWRWTFFGAALMLGIAGWFFTFALHHSDRDVVLLDRHDRRRRRRY